MPGCIIGETEIAVDFWNIRRAPWLRHFFLTHMHTDHIEGLSSTWQHPIYCSEFTAMLLHTQVHLPKRLLRPLTLGERHWIPLDDGRGESMTVTVLDAHHCPGAVMYLFEGHFGCILVTGDFRFCEDMQSDLATFVKAVDVLYVDNTYCDPLCEFGPRSVCADLILSLIRRHPEHRVLLGIHSLGKEELLVEIALAMESWIVVPPDRLTVLSKLNLPNVFTTDSSVSRIQVVPLSATDTGSIARWTAECSTIIIMCTALYTGLDGRPYCNHDNVYIVPYSDHSSYSELRSFVACVQPMSIVPLVPYSKRGPLGTQLQHRADMSCFNDLLQSSQLLPVAAAAAPPSPADARRRRHRQTAVVAAGTTHSKAASDDENHRPEQQPQSMQRAARRLVTAAKRLQQKPWRLQRPRGAVLGVRFADDSSPVKLGSVPVPEPADAGPSEPLPPLARLQALQPTTSVSPESCAPCSSAAAVSVEHVGSTGHESPAASVGVVGRDEDDFISFYVPLSLRVQREHAFSSVLHMLGSWAGQ